MRRKVGKGVLLTAGFSLLLTCVFYLAHDGVLHNSRIIGWQAYTAIDLRPLKSQGSSAMSDAVTSDTDNSTHPSVASSSGSSAQYDDIYPLDFYAPLLPNPRAHHRDHRQVLLAAHQMPAQDHAGRRCFVGQMGPGGPQSQPRGSDERFGWRHAHQHLWQYRAALPLLPQI
ncbi:hypothetical protein L1887_50688 [Cichorium endivia]|nr:hypothetical protein L1887_50688 [Cichorium endivia]